MQQQGTYIERPQLLHAITEHQNTPDIKVITGVRRCGKSTAMAMLADELRRQGVPSTNIFYKRFDAFDIPLDYRAEDLFSELTTASQELDSGSYWYVLLDEIQDVYGWEQVVRRLHTRPNTDVYLTGSNARLLSSDLSTYLTGRYVEINAFPLSLSEYHAFVRAYDTQSNMTEEQPKSLDEHLADYLLFGGMPGIFSLAERNPRTVESELRSIYQSILYKDVAQRFSIRDLEGLDRLARFTFLNAGSLFSIRSVTNALKRAGHSASETAVANMLKALEQAFLVYPAEQAGIQGKEVLRPQRKYYPVDLGFLGLASAFSGRNLGARLECAVALELLRRGYRISVGTGPTSEIDFIAIDPSTSERLYIQVSANIGDEHTRERELRPLKRLTDSFPRLLVTLDHYAEETTLEGIRVVHAASWLTGAHQNRR